MACAHQEFAPFQKVAVACYCAFVVCDLMRKKKKLEHLSVFRYGFPFRSLIAFKHIRKYSALRQRRERWLQNLSQRRISPVRCAVISIKILSFWHAVTVFVKFVCSGFGRQEENLVNAQCAGVLVQGNTVPPTWLYAISVRFSYRKEVRERQGLKSYVTCMERNVSSSAWRIDSLCAWCVETLRNIKITTSVPSMKQSTNVRYCRSQN